MYPVLVHLGKELLVPCAPLEPAIAILLLALTLVASEQARKQDTSTIHSKQCAYGVELGCEDLQDNECKGKLAQCGADVGSFKSPLGCSDLD